MMVKDITNWRSLGGYVGTNGKKVKENMLFRCGQLFDLSLEQKETVRNKYQIKQLIDFRGADERKEYPNYIWNGLTYITLDVLEDAATNQASLDEIISANGDVAGNMLITYKQLALTNSARKGYQQFLLTLVANPVPTAFHCFAGKDRTGVAAALILKCLGVGNHDIFTDYLKTIEARSKANNEILKLLKGKLDAVQLESVKAALTVQPSYLECYFKTIKQNYGDFDNYLVNGLKLPTNFKEKMQGIYLE
ncbi:protein-tyrosine-phosphatase [Lactobacillus bombicola]|uniref:Protein-tyrosine-phosphatase n=2 Tax=Lactobacillus bombicola TaxID=1505723 RepID=A0A396SQ06_9LACO|nr:protein-tyrosine-phosphatase [Lactobacillus bombicola]